MNILKKIYCRTYQTAFHLALPVLPYREPKILKSTDEIASELHSLGLNCTIIVTDEFLSKSGATKKLESSLAEHNIHYTVYDKTRPNPTSANVAEAMNLYIKKEAKSIIAFGGGSAI